MCGGAPRELIVCVCVEVRRAQFQNTFGHGHAPTRRHLSTGATTAPARTASITHVRGSCSAREYGASPNQATTGQFERHKLGSEFTDPNSLLVCLFKPQQTLLGWPQQTLFME
jgi:hypothetical protein